MQRRPAAPQPRTRKQNSRSRHNAVLTLQKYNSNLRKYCYNCPNNPHIPFRARDDKVGIKFLPTAPAARLPPKLLPQSRALQSPPRHRCCRRCRRRRRFKNKPASPCTREAVMQINVGWARWSYYWPRPLRYQPIGWRDGWSLCKSHGFLFEWGKLAPPSAVEERRSEVVALRLSVAVWGVFFSGTALNQWSE